VKNSYFYFDTVHPTSAGFELIARYMQNQIDAPLTVAPQADVIHAATSNFASAILGQLDAYRTFGAFGMGSASFAAAMYVGRKTPAERGGSNKEGPAGDASRWAVWAQGNFSGGSGDRQFYSNGFDYDSPGLTAGIEYRATSFLRYGIAVSFADTDVDLAQQAHFDVSSLQAAAYVSVAYPNWFADALLAYGRHNFDTSRPGIIDTIRGETNGDTFTAAIKSGYLLNAGPVRVGPIAGLTYTSSRIEGYTETGDILLTMKVDDQNFDSLTGSAGVQVRFPSASAGSLYSPFINVTLEHDFLGSGRTITTTQVTTPLLPVLTPIEDRDRTYGKLAGGLAVNISGNADFTLNAFSTFGRSDHNEFGVNAGIRVRF
jgi:outer membrane autotransporter protein